MTKLRNILIKMFSLVFAVSAAFAIATIPQAKTASAAEEASFKVNESSILVYDGEDEGKVGLRFEAEFNKAWLDANPAEKYTFGMIVAPTVNFTAFDEEVDPTANMEAVDGVNIIRIQNTALTAGATFGASILFDDESLKATIAEKLEIEVAAVTPEQVESLKGYIFDQSYSVVAYMSYRDANKQFHYTYIDRYDTSMRETAAKTYALGVAEGNEEYKAIALHYLGVSEDDVANESAYVVKGVRELVVDSVDSDEKYEVKEEDIIVAGGKALKAGADYNIVDNSIVFTQEGRSRSTETLYVFKDNQIDIIEATYVTHAISNSTELIDLFTNPEYRGKTPGGNQCLDSVVVLTQDIDMGDQLLLNHVAYDFAGSFDGRGHVVSNLTVDVSKPKDIDQDANYSLFGNVSSTGEIKNVAFNDLKAINHNPNGALLGYQFEGLMENVYVSYSADNQCTTGMFVLVKKGLMKNVVVVDSYYDTAFDIDAYIKKYTSAYGISLISRGLDSASLSFDNVQVISRRPINYSSTGTNTGVTYNAPVLDNPETTDKNEYKAAYIGWGTRYVYAENETELWYKDFDYFYDEVGFIEYDNGEKLQTGLGLDPDKDEINVETTKSCGKTVVKEGLRRYDDMEAFLEDADEKAVANRAKLLATGLWNEDFVWVNSDNISVHNTYVNEVDYDASTGILYSTYWNGETINKITLNGVELTKDDALIVDGENKIVGIRAKVNADDPNLGIEYKVNYDHKTNVIESDGAIRIYTNNQVYLIRNLNYWTQIIFDAIDLKEALGYNVNYSIVTSTSDTETNREKTLNGKGFFVATTKDGSKYHESVYNVGFYKMMSNIDMKKEGIEYENNPLVSGSKIGGFVGYFDGNGCTIDNFAAGKEGLFGRVGAYLIGNEVNSGKNLRYVQYNPVIKNLAITNAITSYYDATELLSTPILATVIGTDAYGATSTITTVENIYVTVSTTDSTAPGSFVVHLGGHAKVNNVYVVNQNEFNMVEMNSVGYTMTNDPARASATLPAGTKVWDITRNYKEARDGVLFGWAYSGSDKEPKHTVYNKDEGTYTKDYIATDTLDNTTNVHVVTTMPINFSSESSLFVYPYNSKGYLDLQYSAENGVSFNRDNFYKLGRLSANSSTYVAIAYASNETVGNVLVPYAFKQELVDDMKALYAAGKTHGSYGGTVYICTACGKLSVANSPLTSANKNSACKSTENCTGKYTTLDVVGKYKQGGAGPFASSYVYTFTLHTQDDMLPYYRTIDGTQIVESGAVKLAGVYKYANAEAMTNANNDYSSFTGAAGNGMWKVNETTNDQGEVIARELVWVGKVA